MALRQAEFYPPRQAAVAAAGSTGVDCGSYLQICSCRNARAAAIHEVECSSPRALRRRRNINPFIRSRFIVTSQRDQRCFKENNTDTKKIIISAFFIVFD